MIATFDGLTHDPAEFLAFLQKGRDGAAGAAAPAVGSANGRRFAAGHHAWMARPFDTAALSGKVVVVNFWATWCVPCIGRFPASTSCTTSSARRASWWWESPWTKKARNASQPFLKKHPMDYTVALGSAGARRKYNLDELPVTVVFDRSGKQIKRFEGLTSESDLQAAVQQATGATQE